MSLKNITSKVTAVLVSIYLVLGNCSVAGLGIAQAIAEDITTPGLAVDFEITKYVQYNNGGVKATEVGTRVEVSETTEQQRHLPVDSMKLDIQVPSIGEIKPDRVSVVKSNTILTNGTEDYNIDQNYNKDTGLLTVLYNNSNNYSEYKENAKDEFEIIYYYPESTYVEGREQRVIDQVINLEAGYKVDGNILHSTATKQKSATISATELEGDNIVKSAIDYSLINSTDVYKGYMYCNEKNKTNYTTDYKIVSKLSITNKDLIDRIQLNLEKSNFSLNNNESDTNLIQYRYTKISENDFRKVFGQDGALDFYIGTIKYATIKYSEPDDKGNRYFVTEYHTQTKQNIEAGKVEYPTQVVNVKIEGTKPVGEGKVVFENLKQISAGSNYGAKVSDLKRIKESRKLLVTQFLKINGIDEANTVEVKQNNVNIELKEPTTQIGLDLSSDRLATLTTNEITATIKINDTNSSCKLIDGGNVELTLPTNVTNAEVVSAKSLYENGISIKRAKIENGKVILEILGRQTTYDTLNISGGVNIVLTLKIDIADTVATHKETMSVKYNNVTASKEIDVVSMGNILYISKISGYDDKNSETTNIDSATKQIQISETSDAKEVKQTINIVNNYGEDINQVNIIGRLGYGDSSFITKLTRAISVNNRNAKVYYSTNKDATYEDESWTEEFNNNAKAYKIVLNENKLLKDDNVEIILFTQIPERLGYSKKTNIKNDFSYIINGESKTQSSVFNLYTPEEEIVDDDSVVIDNQNPNIQLSIAPRITEKYVHAGQTIVYRVRIKNKTNSKLENISLEDIVPENAIYTYKELKLDNISPYYQILKDENKKSVKWQVALNANEEKEFEIILTVKEDITQQQEIINIVKATYNNTNSTVTSKLTVKPSKVVVNLSTTGENYPNFTFSEGDNVEFHIIIKNTSNSVINNAKVQYRIPTYLTYVEGGLGAFDQFNGYSVTEHGTLNNNIFEYVVNNLNVNEEKTVVIKCKVNRLEEEYEAIINSIVNVIIENDTYQTEMKSIKTVQSAFDIKLQANKTSEDILKKDESVVYTITVKNIGKKSGGFTVKDIIPEQIQVSKIEYNTDNGEVTTINTSKQEIEIVNSLEVGQTLIIKITGNVKEVTTTNGEIIQVSNFANLIRGEYTLNSNNVLLKVQTEKEEPKDNPDTPNTPDTPDTPDNPNTPDTPNNPENPDIPNNPDTPDTPNNPNNPEITTYSISGLVWLDNNKDGKRDEGEKLLSGIKVYLVNAGTAKIVTDSEGKEIYVTTGENGEYRFDGLANGGYLAIFEFDMNQYKATRYQTPNVDSTLNSDAIISKVTIDGNERTVGATNVLDIKSNNLENIDMGLIENAKFDLSLEKQIAKIEVISPQGTKTTEYENLNFAKVDLVAKYMNDTSVIVTYKFVIRNNGDVTGYVDMLQDNLPKGLAFSSELNKDWYKGDDGNLYTTALSGIAIEPGKTSEIELILTKDTTEESTGTFTNNAELTKISNIEAVEEAQKDDNKSSADMLISIKTGSPFLYIGITLGSIVIISAGAYIIRKKVLDREI